VNIREKTLEFATEALEAEGFELVELKLAQYQNKYRAQFFVDSDNGVKLEDCARLSRLLAGIFDEADLFRNGYTIDVSSPGLDRPLKSSRDFKRRVGEKIKLFFIDDKPAPVEGELIGSDDEKVVLKIDDSENAFELSNIRVGKIII